MKPELPPHKTGKKVAVVGSGPAGMACAQQLARAGHDVHVYERWAKAGGLLRYGIPDFKMEKIHVDRRVEQMDGRGRQFHYGADVGVNCRSTSWSNEHDAVVLTGGAEKPRDLPIPGRELKGIHFAMDFLPQQNRRVSGEPHGDVEPILATGKKVVVIGGGDTGSDCIGTSIRQGAVSVTNFEIMPQPPEHENKMLTWPDWPLKMRTSSSHQEGVERDFAVRHAEVPGENGAGEEAALRAARRQVQAHRPAPNSRSRPIWCCWRWASCIRCTRACSKALDVALDQRGNISADTNAYSTSVPKVFAAGDMRRGQSLVVWAIREGRQAAHAVDKFLMGSTTLPR